jgi:hypothetical protein
MQAGDSANAMTAAAMTRVEITLCYCSIYDDCWVSGLALGRESKREVRQCPAPSAEDFSQ